MSVQFLGLLCAHLMEAVHGVDELLRLYLSVDGKVYHVVDPAIVHGRVELRKGSGSLLVHARKTGQSNGFYASPPQQSDYLSLWEDSVAARIPVRRPMASSRQCSASGFLPLRSRRSADISTGSGSAWWSGGGNGEPWSRIDDSTSRSSDGMCLPGTRLAADTGRDRQTSRLGEEEIRAGTRGRSSNGT